ncbi:hypothetical protein O181_032094 [Austropuccinia psidii MF-1]|uniref:Reverse transcriptase Ty1/copia-type domain-containing protein n=1 Tax=Austropuccinia psidii MF-1 TaxID=1389203 RepID=A0A9Q3CWU8_9BASI|nr:hypothetical protein [Austropuccinia psidii MF-1]
MALLWIHIDDGALTLSLDKLLEKISEKFSKALKIKWDQRINGLVGLPIESTVDGFNTTAESTAESPLPPNCNLISGPSRTMDIPYLKRIGILLYITQGSYPDITFGVSYLVQFLLGTDNSHWAALKHLIAYPCYMLTTGILINRQNVSEGIKCYVDAKWAGEGECSSHGFLLLQKTNFLAIKAESHGCLFNMSGKIHGTLVCIKRMPVDF